MKEYRKLRTCSEVGHKNIANVIEDNIKHNKRYEDLLDTQNQLKIAIRDRILENNYFDELSLNLYKEIRGVSLESEIIVEMNQLKCELEDAQETVKYLKDCIKEKEDILNKI